jgi:hypothetical protein
MIFGYGDEQDENFNLLEKYDDCLKFVKGYKYLHTNTYKNFLNFIENDDYEVFTLGHSCNLSDKTMLSELFNNSRCKKIKILTYVKSNELDGLHSTNYNEVCYAIGRVFSNKGDLRRKVITYNKEDVLCLSRKYKPEVIS